MRRLVLLDRDGTINVEKEYLSSPDQVELLPGAAEGIRLIRGLGLQTVIVTNQSAIGRGYFGLDELDRIHQHLRELLMSFGATLDAIYVCPHTPEEGCDCRKPAPGLALKASDQFKADLSQSFVVGDKACDIELGKRVGATTILVRTGYGARVAAEMETQPDYVVEGLLEAARIIQRLVAGEEGEAQMNTNTKAWRTIIREHLLGSSEVKHSTIAACTADISEAAELLVNCFNDRGKVMLCGNGGSAADCQHIAAEFVNILRPTHVRPPLAAIALTTDTSFLTASANDFGFEGVFARQIEALGKNGDVLITLSTSGNSLNILQAVRRAHELGIKTIGLTGDTGGELSKLADAVIRVPSSNTQHIQETHIAIGHIICSLVEGRLFGDDQQQAIADIDEMSKIPDRRQVIERGDNDEGQSS